MINFSFKKNFDIKKNFSFLFTFIFILLSISLVVFIFYKSIYFIDKNGLKTFNFLISGDWKPSDNEFYIGNFIVSTFWTIFFSLILIVKINLFVAIFISKFLNKKIKKVVVFFLRVLSGIPSVLFGIFVLFSVGPILKALPGGDETSMLSAIIVLTIIALPITLTLTVNLLDNVSKNNELSGLALGNEKTVVMFNIVKKTCSKSIRIILFLAFCRILAEASALTLVSGGGAGLPNFKNGFSGFFFSSIRTLTTVISLEFKENFNKLHEASLFFVSFLLFVIVLISNLIFAYLNKEYEKKEKSLFKINIKIFNFNFLQKFKNYKLPIIRYYWNKFLVFYRKFNMYFLSIIIFSIFVWLIGSIFINGINGFIKYDFKDSSLISGEDGILGILLSTLILISVSLIFTFPIALFTSVFITEYSYNSKKLRNISKIIRFIIIQLASTPGILFGMFGFILFVTYFGLGFTLISGGLTMILIIFPIMVQTIIQNLEIIPKTYRYSAYALGLSERVVIWKIIVPMAIKGILISLILGINRIIAESAPLLIVLGNSTSVPDKGMISDTRTLATHIWLISSASPLDADNTHYVVYQSALIVLIVIILLNLLINKLKKIKKN